MSELSGWEREALESRARQKASLPGCANCEVLRGIIAGMADRIAAQSEILSRRAERVAQDDSDPADDQQDAVTRLLAERDRLACDMADCEAAYHDAAKVLENNDRLREENTRLRALLRGHEQTRDERDALLADSLEVGRVIGCDHSHSEHARCVRERIAALEAALRHKAREVLGG